LELEVVEVVEVEKEEQESSQSRFNNRHTPTFFHRLDVLGETNQLSIPMSDLELICKSSKGVRTGGGGEGEGGDGEEVEQPAKSQSWTYAGMLASS
jgi:hypothetical protein